jgi:cytochrome P450
MQINTTTRSVNLDPRNSQFVQDPYAAYREIRAALPAFKWEQYGHWCFANHEDV